MNFATRNARVLFALAVPLLLMVVSSLSQPNSPPVQDIVRRSAEAVRGDWEKAPRFDFCETDQVKDGSKTYEVLMIAGSPYNRLVAVNGQVLATEENEKEAQRLQAIIERRQAETMQEHEQRVREYEKERQRDHLLLEQLTDAMEFTLAGAEKVGSYDTYVLEARPKPGYVPKSKEGTVFTGMRGKMWIDETSFRWVKVEAEVVHPVMIEGFLARVEPGTRFELEELPIDTDKDIWLPNHFSMHFRAKVLLIFEKSAQADETYFHYRSNGSLSAESCQQP